MTAADMEYQRRAPMMVPGALIHSATFDKEKLEKWYCWSCMCPVKADMARRTYVDVYSTGVATNAPAGACCCFWVDNGQYLHYDDKRVGDVWDKAGCCKPFPYCFPHCCHCCGEVVYVNQCCGCCTASLPLCAGHMCGDLCCCFCGMAKYDAWVGLKVGEADLVKQKVDEAKRRGPGTVADRAGAQVAQMIPMGQPVPQEMVKK